jgi:exodeoxyribonuclease VII large subunit
MGLPTYRQTILYPARRILTITELTNRIKHCIEEGVGHVWVCGEVSNLKTHASGHLYFDLKDEQSKIAAVVWKSQVARLRFKLKDGMEVVIFGKVSIYPSKSSYQIQPEILEPRGIGALQLAFEQLKQKLMREGMFDQARKRGIPFLPSRIGIVTSIDGAAIHDILRVIRGRFPKVGLLICPVRVQGEGAAEEIAEAIQALNMLGDQVEVMIVGRGGGSLEDLWPFNEEVVARAIYNSRIPVISAVGHEVDYTIADFVADLRALTPTHAATQVVPDEKELLNHLTHLGQKLKEALCAKISVLHKELEGIRQHRVLHRPVELVYHAQQRLDDLAERLDVSIGYRVSQRPILIQLQQRLQAGLQRSFEAFRAGLAGVSQRLRDTLVTEPIQDRYKHLNEQSRLMFLHVYHTIKVARDRLSAITNQLDSLSPLKVLARGYSITFRRDGRILRKATEVEPQELIRSKLMEGEIVSKVTQIKPKAER